MKLDGITLIATPRYTHVSRGSSSVHPQAIDFGWNGEGTQNQPLYCGIIGSSDVTVARKRFTPGGPGSGSTGHVIDIRFETENHTCYRSSMHMREASPLAVGTRLEWNSVIGTMGSTGDSTGPHDHVILAICPKGTPVESMYAYRVTPDQYYHYLNDWHVADNKLPWVDLDGGGEEVPTPSDKLVITFENTNSIGKEFFTMSDIYKLVSVKGNVATLEKVVEVDLSIPKGFKPEKGSFTTDRVVRVRTQPSTSGKIVRELKTGEKLDYDSYGVLGGYVWVSTIENNQRVYSAWRVNGGVKYGFCNLR